MPRYLASPLRSWRAVGWMISRALSVAMPPGTRGRPDPSRPICAAHAVGQLEHGFPAEGGDRVRPDVSHERWCVDSVDGRHEQPPGRIGSPDGEGDVHPCGRPSSSHENPVSPTVSTPGAQVRSMLPASTHSSLGVCSQTSSRLAPARNVGDESYEPCAAAGWPSPGGCGSGQAWRFPGGNRSSGWMGTNHSRPSSG